MPKVSIATSQRLQNQPDAAQTLNVTTGPMSRLRAAVNGPIATAFLIGANVSACKGNAAWTLGCLTAAAGAKHAAHPIAPGGYAMLAAAGLYCGIRSLHGASPWLDVPVALAGIGLCVKQVEAFEAWPWLDHVRLRDDAVLYTSRVETDKVLVGALALLLRQLEPATQATPNKLASLAVGMTTIAALMGAGVATNFVRIDAQPPKLLTTLTWCVVNLTLVAASEEALFRGLPLSGLQKATSGWPLAQLWPSPH